VKNLLMKYAISLRFRMRFYKYHNRLNHQETRASQNDFFLNRPKWHLKNGEKPVKFVLGALQLVDIINISMV